MSSIVVLRQADRRWDGPPALWDIDPALLESLRALADDAASVGTGARLVMALPRGAPETLVSARCHRAGWRAVVDAVLERGDIVQDREVAAAPVDGPRGMRGVFVLYGDDLDARCAAVVRAYASHAGAAIRAAEARRAAAQATADALLRALTAHDPEMARHAIAVRRLALTLGGDYGLSPHELLLLDRAALLHDLGKIHLSRSILSKDEPLDQSEWACMRQHPAQGEAILRAVPDLSACAPIVRHHHERWDGAGYPDRLSGAAIPIGARIVALVDAYEVMRAGRPYRAARAREDALAELASCAGSQFDPSLVRAFAAIPYHTLGL